MKLNDWFKCQLIVIFGFLVSLLLRTFEIVASLPKEFDVTVTHRSLVLNRLFYVA